MHSCLVYLFLFLLFSCCDVRWFYCSYFEEIRYGLISWNWESVVLENKQARELE